MEKPRTDEFEISCATFLKIIAFTVALVFGVPALIGLSHVLQ